jgi:hypothetical protein
VDAELMQSWRVRTQGTITQGRETTAVDCVYEITDPGTGLKEWYGRYEGADPASEPQAGEATLKVDSAEAKIIITSASLGTGSGRFEGRGEPPPRR